VPLRRKVLLRRYESSLNRARSQRRGRSPCVCDVRRAKMSNQFEPYGSPTRHVDGMGFLPRPVQRPGVPIWVAGRYGKAKPLRRAARFQGFFPVNFEHPDQLAEMIAEILGS
jgi:alkanesulfonate monooxygenase SsuD/methylene tetrahydromethanopterin reductase-like flavin-dependent oxidoreductase (luciferase family)